MRLLAFAALTLTAAAAVAHSGQPSDSPSNNQATHHPGHGQPTNNLTEPTPPPPPPVNEQAPEGNTANTQTPPPPPPQD
jgi:hypothetical protein